uniref:Uncharacterized protein n=1 Tax=Micrurus lemniscatus lemniscatus TaxID=129467 RepID=A0A2D4JD80_MICLE
MYAKLQFFSHSNYSPLSLEVRKEKNPINWTVIFKYCPLYAFACKICYFITVEGHACLHLNSHECFKNPTLIRKSISFNNLLCVNFQYLSGTKKVSKPVHYAETEILT